MKPQERRRHPRGAPAKGLKVRCFSDEPQGKLYNHAERILDASMRGICLVTVGRLRAGVPMLVEILAPNGTLRFRSKAIVAWSTTVESRGRTAHVAGLHLERSILPPAPRKPAEPEAPPARLIPSRTPEPQRAHKRFTPDEVEIVCLPRGFLSALGLASNTGRRLKDLSLGGAQIVCSRKLETGEAVDLDLEFRRSKLRVKASAEVQWCRRDTSSLEPRYLVGLRFTKLPKGSDHNLRAIERAFLGF